MKQLIALIFLGSFSLGHSQTSIIAHKSHSGTSEDFFNDPSSNFGAPPPRLIQVIRINDSTRVNVLSSFDSFIYHDTVHYTKKEAKMMDSIYEQKSSEGQVELIHFKNSPDSLTVKTPTPIIQPKETDIQPQPEAVPKKKKKSYVLFLFGITGGGMLLIRLFSKSKTTNALIS